MRLLRTIQDRLWLWRMDLRHRWLTVSVDIPDGIRYGKLYRKLQKVERQIIKIAGDEEAGHRWWKDGRKEEQLEELLSNRCYLLNQMFVVTSDVVARMEEINTQLYNLTQKMYAQSARLYRRELAVAIDSEFDNIVVRGALYYCHNGENSVLQLSDDAFYGSNFNRMVELIHSVEAVEEIASVCKYLDCGDVSESSDAKLGFEDWSDDGTSWAEGWLRCKEFEHISICHAIHDLCTHKHYSIPDLLRLNNFVCEITVKYQHIEE